MRMVMGLGLAGLLAACNQSNDTAVPNGSANQTIAVRSDGQNLLHRLNDLDRAIGLKRAIYDSGNTCKRIVKSGFVTNYHKLDMWTATCDDHRQWAIFVGADDSAQVRDCSTLAALKLPECKIAAVDPLAPRTTPKS